VVSSLPSERIEAMKGLMEAKTALCREIPLYQSSLHKIFRSVKLSLLKESLHCEKISEINLVFSVSFESRVTTVLSAGAAVGFLLGFLLAAALLSLDFPLFISLYP